MDKKYLADIIREQRDDIAERIKDMVVSAQGTNMEFTACINTENGKFFIDECMHNDCSTWSDGFNPIAIWHEDSGFGDKFHQMVCGSAFTFEEFKELIKRIPESEKSVFEHDLKAFLHDYYYDAISFDDVLNGNAPKHFYRGYFSYILDHALKESRSTYGAWYDYMYDLCIDCWLYDNDCATLINEAIDDAIREAEDRDIWIEIEG